MADITGQPVADAQEGPALVEPELQDSQGSTSACMHPPVKSDTFTIINVQSITLKHVFGRFVNGTSEYDLLEGRVEQTLVTFYCSFKTIKFRVSD